MFHLGYATKFGPPAWQADSERTHGADWWNGDYFAELAGQLEAASFGLLFFEDTLTVSRKFAGKMDADLRHALYTPKHDPVALLANLAGRTERIGLVATASTQFYPPFLLARLFSTIDSLSAGRAGWNIVTSSLVDEARNFGTTLPDPTVRYDMADEFVELAKQLWGSWEDGAVVADPERGIYVDPAKVHEVDFRGAYHSSRGPLNTIPSPQGMPLLAQAGSSPRGREFAARHAELVFSFTAGGVPAMRAFRDDLHQRMRRAGRRPEEAKVFWAAPINITHPDDPPPRGWDEERLSNLFAYWSAVLDIDLSPFDPDEPLPEDAETLGTRSLVEALRELGRHGKSLREGLIEMHAGNDELGLVGPADVVAENLAAAMEEVGGDGIMVISADVGTAEHVRRITAELAPRLQELGCVPSEYRGGTLRKNLFAF